MQEKLEGFSSNVFINSNLYVQQNTTIASTLSNAGNVSFSSNLYINQNGTVSNTLSNASFGSTAIFLSNVVITGQLTAGP
jgi:hypothetical protein